MNSGESDNVIKTFPHCSKGLSLLRPSFKFEVWPPQSVRPFSQVAGGMRVYFYFVAFIKCGELSHLNHTHRELSPFPPHQSIRSLRSLLVPLILE